ncbi:MAG TPA: M15 family metallopeptidase, partial [Acidimicrobiales bacterium]
PTRRSPLVRILVVGLALALAAVAAVSGYRLLTLPPLGSAGSSALGPTTVDPTVLGPADGAGPDGPLGTAGGAVPDGATVYDDHLPAVANLDPALLAALRRATTEAADDGVTLHVNSGWRSPAYQERLFDEAVAEHGSAQEAARWVATAETSAHVAGDAVDIGPPEAADWLADEGDDHGLCPVYDNEPWHFELRPEAAVSGCPPTYSDPTEDPRMRR